MPCFRELKVHLSSSVHRSNQLPLPVPVAVKPPPAEFRTSTVTDRMPWVQDTTPRMGKEELPSVRWWVTLPPMASESLQPG